jgi:hypothetical protein
MGCPQGHLFPLWWRRRTATATMASVAQLERLAGSTGPRCPDRLDNKTGPEHRSRCSAEGTAPKRAISEAGRFSLRPTTG